MRKRATAIALEEFLGERCELGPAYRVPFGELFDAYGDWCSSVDLDPLSKQSFAKALSARGFTSRVIKQFRVLEGLRLRPDDEAKLEVIDEVELARVVKRYREALEEGDPSLLSDQESKLLACAHIALRKDLAALLVEGLAIESTIMGADGKERSKLRENPRANAVVKFMRVLGLTGRELQLTPASQAQGRRRDAETRAFDRMVELYERTEERRRSA